jgi:hypothetical protein
MLPIHLLYLIVPKSDKNKTVLGLTNKFVFKLLNQCTVGGQIKLGHLKFNLCKSDH